MPVIVPVTVVGAALAKPALNIKKMKPANIPIKFKRSNLVTRNGETFKIP